MGTSTGGTARHLPPWIFGVKIKTDKEGNLPKLELF